ncbi:MAG: 50S ribosomal protein L5, partial [Burkholderiaceae bacterium]
MADKQAAKKDAGTKKDGGAKKDAAAPKQSKKEAPAKSTAPKIELEQGPQAAAGPARLQVHYRETIVPELMKKFGYKSSMQVPRLQKITLNMGVSEAVADKKVMDNAVADLTKIAGQKPVVTKSKKAIANFK